MKPIAKRFAAGGALTAVLLISTAASPAYAAAVVDAVTDDGRQLTAAADASTVLTVTGSGFQSIQAGFGGIYVMFGTVSGDAWQPSAGGASGVDYRYVNDDPDAPAGFQQFIAFPGSSTEAEASGGAISPEGDWQATITVPGAVLDMTDSSGAITQVDCRIDSCGIITIGAHGVVNANNESFTPIRFEDTVPEPTPEPTMTTMSEPEQQAAASQDSAALASDTGGDATIGILIGAAVVAGLAAVLAAALLRRRRDRALSDDDA